MPSLRFYYIFKFALLLNVSCKQVCIKNYKRFIYFSTPSLTSSLILPTTSAAPPRIFLPTSPVLLSISPPTSVAFFPNSCKDSPVLLAANEAFFPNSCKDSPVLLAANEAFCHSSEAVWLAEAVILPAEFDAFVVRFCA
jgi:hypothetical protein